MTQETDLKKLIKDYLDIKGFFHWYNLQGLGAYKGAPDMFAIRNGQVFALEIKKKEGVLSKFQERFKENYEGKGGTYVVVRGLEDLPF